MPTSPKEVADKIQTVITAWDSLASDASFAGMTLAKFKAAVQPSLDAREEVTNLHSQRPVSLNKRAAADQASNAAILMVVNAIKGDPDHGEDSPLYAAMGYVRKSDRRTGAHRNGNGATTPAAVAA
jgi:hypothetical protein